MSARSSLLHRCASVAGARHRAIARNCQDAVATWVASDQTWGLAVVCDGCGSQPHSEFGALWGRQAWSLAVQRAVAAGVDLASSTFWSTVSADVVTSLTMLAEQCSGSDEHDRTKFVQQHLLFTSLVGVVHDQTVSVLALGDGMALLGDETYQFGPWADNAPPYIAYALIDPAFVPIAIATVVTRDKADVDRLAVASDGIDDFAGGLRGLLTERVVRNPDGLRRALEIAARATELIDWAAQCMQRLPGCLQDDTAVALLQWSPSPEAESV
ncbi:MAG: protein phosphatase 2C domain-containing protein [Kofleriaceae bacterium]|nr:protein phosphatase 2C domain-containing protein [Kofleriaceae bacterium]